jgi:tripartite-type tricarboxylate transporter receptor subunit TctC
MRPSLLLTSFIAGVVACGAALAQTGYPTKPIRMIIPLAAGSAVDVAARIVTAKMSVNMGQQVVIENMPGAAGIIGAERVAKAAPDGYTVGGFNDSIMTMVPHISANVPWNILKDFDPVSLVATVEWGIAVNPGAPYKTAGELIAAAKAAPGRINYGSGGNGSPQHIGMALFASQAGISVTHVPYKGATQAATGTAGGEVPVTMQGLATIAPLVRGGKLRLVGVSMKTRHPQFADAPPIADSGLPGFEFNSWFAILAPAGTPKEITHKLSAEVVKALADPDVREKLNLQGLTPRGSTPEELGAMTKSQLERYGKLIRDAGIKAE